MSLTSHLKNRSSPVRQFMERQFPNTRAVAKESRPCLAGTEAVPWPEGATPSVLALGFDYRVRFAFGSSPGADRRPAVFAPFSPAYEGAFAFMVETCADDALIDRFRAYLLETTRELGAMDRVLDDVAEDRLGRICVVLGLFDTVYRIGVHPRLPLVYPVRRTSLDGLLAIADPVWLLDIRERFTTFTSAGANLLTGVAEIGPTFAGSGLVEGADADLIVDGCLLELKDTTRQPRWCAWLYQLLGYALLDFNDRYRINAVALYLARRGVLLRWPIDDLIARLSGADAQPLPTLRERFQNLSRTLGQFRPRA